MVVATAAARARTPYLTIGMATYDGVYFTLQGLRLHHPEVAQHVEFVVLDNHPDGPAAPHLRQLASWIDGCRYVPEGTVTGTAVRDLIIRQANTPFVMIMDCHVLCAPGSLARLLDYLRWRPDTIDLLQGPLLSDDLTTLSTHFAPTWGAGMYGQWANDERGMNPDGPPFDIPMQGLGLFACRRDAWPGFNPRFRGFGGEEGYIHERFRRAGGRTLCLPFLRWLHRFARPAGVPYPNTFEDRLRNYLIGWTELGLDTAPVDDHFRQLMGEPAFTPIRHAIQQEIDGFVRHTGNTSPSGQPSCNVV